MGLTEENQNSLSSLSNSQTLSLSATAAIVPVLPSTLRGVYFSPFSKQTPFKLSEDETKASAFPRQQPSSPTLLGVFTSSPFPLLNLRCYTSRPRLCTVSPCPTFLILSQNMSPFCLSLPCYQLWRFPSLPCSQKTVIFLARRSWYMLHSPCGEAMILFKTSSRHHCLLQPTWVASTKLVIC